MTDESTTKRLNEIRAALNTNPGLPIQFEKQTVQFLLSLVDELHDKYKLKELANQTNYDSMLKYKQRVDDKLKELANQTNYDSMLKYKEENTTLKQRVDEMKEIYKLLDNNYSNSLTKLTLANAVVEKAKWLVDDTKESWDSGAKYKVYKKQFDKALKDYESVGSEKEGEKE